MLLNEMPSDRYEQKLLNKLKNYSEPCKLIKIEISKYIQLKLSNINDPNNYFILAQIDAVLDILNNLNKKYNC